MHKPNLNPINNCWAVIKYLVTSADNIAVRVQKTGYLLHMM